MYGEEFWILLAFLAVAALILVPIITLVLLVKIRRGQEDVSQQLDRVEGRLMQLAMPAKSKEKGLREKPEAAKTKPEPDPKTEPPHIVISETAPAKPSPVKAVEVSTPRPATSAVGSPLPASPSITQILTPKEPSPFEVAARKALEKIWNWIIVGEEYRSRSVSMEFAVATTWLLRVGIIILVVGIGFFLKYSVENGLLGPLGRVTLSLVSGAALLAVGVKLLGKKYHLLGQGLIGGGLATLYFAVYAASVMYGLIGIQLGFVLMAVVTLGAGLLSVRVNSLLVAVLGIVGGYATPILLPSADGGLLLLFGYMLILGIGILGIAARKDWPLLTGLSMLLGYLVYGMAMEKAYQQETDFWLALLFVIGFFVVFSTSVFLFNLVNRRKSSALELAGLMINAGACFYFAYVLVHDAFGKQWASLVSLGLSAFYTAHVLHFLNRRLVDRNLITSFIGLASLFLAITIPLFLSRDWITAGWALQALAMLWFSVKRRSQFLRHVAFLLYLIMFGRFFVLDLSAEFGSSTVPEGTGVLKYLGMLLEHLAMFGVPIASVGGGMYLLKKPAAEGPVTMGAGNDTPGWVQDQMAVPCIVGGIFAMLFVYLHLEVNRTMDFLFPPFRLTSLTILWLLACLFFLRVYQGVQESRIIRLLVYAFVGGMVMKVFFVDIASWSFDWGHMMYRSDYSFMDAGMRLLDFGMVTGLFMYGFFLLGRYRLPSIPRALFGYAALAMLFIYSSLEVNSFLAHYQPGLRAGGNSIHWSLFALGLLLGGILKNIRPLRFLGLGLFGIVAVKVFVSDLSNLDPVFRIAAFIILGILLLAGSFLYLKFSSRFSISSTTAKEDV